MIEAAGYLMLLIGVALIVYVINSGVEAPSDRWEEVTKKSAEFHQKRRSTFNDDMRRFTQRIRIRIRNAKMEFKRRRRAR